MITLFILITSFLFALIFLRALKRNFSDLFAARIALSVMLLFTATSHFVYTNGMELMVPTWIPHKKTLILAAGFIEIALAMTICIPRLRKVAGWSLIAFLFLIFPANIKAAVDRIDFKNTAHLGSGMMYLWLRVPLQLFFIAWTYWCCLTTKSRRN